MEGLCQHAMAMSGNETHHIEEVLIVTCHGDKRAGGERCRGREGGKEEGKKKKSPQANVEGCSYVLSI